MGNGKWIVEEASSGGSGSDSDSDNLGVTSIKSVTDVAGFLAGSRFRSELGWSWRPVTPGKAANVMIIAGI